MIDKVVFTGIDARTDIWELQAISQAYPFVEFGVLMSENNTGSGEKNRYPGPDFIRALKSANLPLSAHICGKLAREAVQTGKFNDIVAFLNEMEAGQMFQRYQLNVASLLEKEDSGVSPFAYEGDRPIILQVAGPKGEAFYRNMQAISSGKICEENLRGEAAGRDKQVPLVHALFDKSSGEGKEFSFDDDNEVVMDAPGYVGYAGGVGPNNIAFYLGYFCAGRAQARNTAPFFLDMESGVRTDDWFDTSKVRAVLEILKSFVIL